MNVESFVKILDSGFYTGVPDSLLKDLCNYLMDKYKEGTNHIIAANEGNCTALAAGYHLATNKIPVVYMQNSGQGNALNPVVSLLNEKVYSIPVIFLIGWRGEPGISDEPQHRQQGEVTLKLLEIMGIQYYVIDKNTGEEELIEARKSFSEVLAKGRQVAFVIKKGSLFYDKKVEYKNTYTMKREEALAHIIHYTQGDPIVSTTGKTSRELFEIRTRKSQSHEQDFLTVGSMGHSSSIALGIALSKPHQKVWSIDGDGAAIMHMGAMAVIGATKLGNMVHIVINNESHESVGGLPTAANHIDFVRIAKGCGYSHAVSVEKVDFLDKELKMAKERKGLTFIEVKCAIGSRADLGRPTTTALENKKRFMQYLGRL